MFSTEHIHPYVKHTHTYTHTHSHTHTHTHTHTLTHTHAHTHSLTYKISYYISYTHRYTHVWIRSSLRDPRCGRYQMQKCLQQVWSTVQKHDSYMLHARLSKKVSNRTHINLSNKAIETTWVAMERNGSCHNISMGHACHRELERVNEWPRQNVVLVRVCLK